MDVYPVVWSFKRESTLPIIVVMGQSMVKESEALLIKKAIKFIVKAKKFRGVPREEPLYPSDKFALTVAFSLIFPSEKMFDSFVETISKERP